MAKRADQLRPTIRRLTEFMDEAETDILAYMTFPKEHWTKIDSVNPLERRTVVLNAALMWWASFRTKTAITRLVGAILLEGECRVGRPARPLSDPGNHRSLER